MNIWKILEISETKDKDEIREAYRTKLTRVNPEEDQKGFMELRQAYEEALKKADMDEEEETSGREEEIWDDTEVGDFMRRVNEVYKDIKKRVNTDIWSEMLEEDVCFSLETKTEVRDELLRYFMRHKYLPNSIWKLLDEKFMLREYKEELYEIFPVDYINRGVIENIIYDDFINPDYLESLGGDDYDEYLQICYNVYPALSQSDFDKVEEFFDKMEELKIYHPFEDMFKACYFMRKDNYEEAKKYLDKIIDKYPNDPEILRNMAIWYNNTENYEDSAKYYEKVLALKPEYYNALIEAGNAYFSIENYKVAKEKFDKAYDIHKTEYIQERIMNCVEELEKQYTKIKEEHPEDIKNIIELARTMYQQGRFEESTNMLLEVIPDEENSLEHTHLLGCNYMYQEEYDKALPYLMEWMEKTEGLEPDGTEEMDKAIKRLSSSYMCIAQTLSGMERYDEAEEYIDKSIATGVHVIDAYEDKGRMYYKQKRYEEAIYVCDKIIELDAASPIGHSLRANALQEMGYLEDADEEWQKCINYEPYNLMGYMRRIEVLSELDRTDTMEEIIHYLEENEVEDDKLDMWKAVLKGKTDEYETAKKELMAIADKVTKELEEHTGSTQQDKGMTSYLKKLLSEVYYQIGRIYYFKDDSMEDSKLYIDKSLSYNDEYPAALNYKAFIAWKEKKYEEAIDLYKKLLEIKPYHNCANGRLGEIYEETSRYDEAVKFYSNQLKFAPNPYIYLSRGWCYAKMYQFDEARSDYEKCIELEPDGCSAYRNLANTYRYDEQEEKAVDLYKKGIELDVEGNEPWAYKDLAVAYGRILKYEDAIEVLKTVINKYDRPEHILELARMYRKSGRYEEARAVYSKYASLGHKYKYTVMDEICNTYLLEGNLKCAKKVYAESVSCVSDSEFTDENHRNMESCRVLINLYQGKKVFVKLELKNLIDFYLNKGINSLEDAAEIIQLKILSQINKGGVSEVDYHSKLLKPVVDALEKDADSDECSVEDEDRYFNAKAMVCLERGDLKTAMMYAEKSLNNRKCFHCKHCKCTEALFIKALILELSGNDREALVYYKEASQFDADIMYTITYNRMNKKLNGKK